MDARQEWAEILAAAAEPAQRREEAVHTAMRLGLAVAPAAVGCSLTEQVGSGFRTTASANELATALDRAQYAAGAGPCLSAATTGTVERLDRIDPGAGRSAYAGFVTAAREHGVLSSLSVPLAGVDRPAALNFYAGVPGGFPDPGAGRTADLLARAVAALRRGGPVMGVPENGGLSLLDGLTRCGMDYEELWLRQIGLGGDAGQLEVEAYVLGVLEVDRYQHDLLAQALNECFLERGENHPVAYRGLPAID